MKVVVVSRNVNPGISSALYYSYNYLCIDYYSYKYVCVFIYPLFPLSFSSYSAQNHDFKDNPERFRSVLVEPLMEESEGSPKLSSLQRGGNKKSFRVQGSGRNQSLTGKGFIRVC